MKIIFVLIALLVFISGCGREDSSPVGGSPTPVPEPGPIEEAIVRANCLTVKAAVEEFARENDGIYPSDTDTDVTPSGGTVVDLMPGMARLLNPYTLVPTEPVNIRAALPGETGYTPIVQNIMNVGYIITGVGGEPGEEILRITSIDDPEAVVKRNCLFVHEAAKYFSYNNNNVYPANVDADTNTAGRTLIYYLGKEYLENPYTGYFTEPRNGKAILPGEVGYEALFDGDINYGYNVTGVGKYPGIHIAKFRVSKIYEEQTVKTYCNELKESVRYFTSRNNAKYPKDIDTDTDQVGHTLRDYIFGSYWENPFTQAATEPRNRRAFNPGEIGYEAIDEGRGYIITGVGKKTGEIISEFIKIDSPADTMVKFNYVVFQEAIEKFAALNDGIYPIDIYQDGTPTGETVIDLLPGSGFLLNPVTGLYSEPQNRLAAYPGEVGYNIYQGVYSYYTVAGIGDDGFHIIRCWKYIYND